MSLIKELEGIRVGAVNGKARLQELREKLIKKKALDESVNASLQGLDDLFGWMKNKL